MDYAFEAIISLTPQELKNYGRFHSTYVQRWRTLLSGLLALLMMAMGGVLLVLGSNREFSPFILIAAGLLLLVMLGWQAGGWATAKRNNNKLGIREVRVRFYDDRLEIADQQVQGFYYYDQLHRAYETKNYFFVYTAKNQSCFFPRDGFTHGTAEGLRELLWARLGEKFQVTGWK